MTTLISVYVAQRCVGRCDAKCYDAEHDDCSCVCGGKNHGKGVEEAKRNIREEGDIMAEKFAEYLDLHDWEAMVNVNIVYQLPMPLLYHVDRIN